jgi:hypothetical protein
MKEYLRTTLFESGTEIKYSPRSFDLVPLFVPFMTTETNGRPSPFSSLITPVIFR